MNTRYLACVVLFLAACQPAKEYKKWGSIERTDPALDQIISPHATPEILADGFTWSEGPVWVESQNMLLFTDVPQDTAYKWTETGGKEVYLTPSGFTGTPPAYSRERGANGLIINNKGQLVLCQHGDRRLAVMDAPLDKPAAKYITLADRHNGKRFNSPNDVVMDASGNYLFTDPPYGLMKMEQDSTKEIPHQGVYKLTTDGKVHLLVDSITKPNGIAFTPDGKSVYIACSDPDRARWYKYELGDTTVTSGTVFFDATAETKTLPGLPDGLKVDRNGNLFASGPGGIFIISPEGKLLGKVKLPDAAANCALSPDEKTLYITNKSYLLRLKMR